MFTAPEIVLPLSVIRKWYDGSSSSTAAENAQAIKDIANLSSSDDGLYWIKPYGRSAIQVYCEFNSFGGWMLFAKGEASGTPFPTGTGSSGSILSLDGSKGKHADADFNAIKWNHAWISISGSSSINTMDSGRQLFSTNGLKFNIIWLRQYNQWTGGNTGNGRNQIWSYKSPAGSGGSSLTGSARQPGSTVINAAGSTDYAIGNTNTYGIAPHDAGIGGFWIFADDGTTGGAMVNNGFGADHNNVSWTSRRSFWLFK